MSVRIYLPLVNAIDYMTYGGIYRDVWLTAAARSLLNAP